MLIGIETAPARGAAGAVSGLSAGRPAPFYDPRTKGSNLSNYFDPAVHRKGLAPLDFLLFRNIILLPWSIAGSRIK